MVRTMTRLMVSVPYEAKKQIDIIKQRDYYDKPYSELYRQIIRLGLEKMNENMTEKSVRNA